MIRYDVINVKIPRIKAFTRVIELGVKEEAKVIQSQMGQFFMTWKGKPDVKVEVARVGDSIVATAYLTGDKKILDIAKWVIYGTEQHDIPLAPKQEGQLRYPDTFTPKTQPGVLQSRAGGKSGEPTFHGKQVTHPGIEPRRTFEIIAEGRKKHFRLRMINSIRKGLAAAIRQGLKR